jgi:hypothetical protein
MPLQGSWNLLHNNLYTSIGQELLSFVSGSMTFGTDPDLDSSFLQKKGQNQGLYLNVHS